MNRPVVTPALVSLVVTSALVVFGSGSALAAPDPDGGAPSSPLVIAHRGASGYLPEHTLEAYRLGVEMGADYIEPDIVMTSDGVAIARHDNVLDLTTDVATRPEFADKRTTKTVDGVEIEGWFSEDFTLAEIKTLRAIERIPDVRPDNTAFDGQFEVPTLDEVLELVADLEAETGRTIGVYPETKHPTHFADLGLDINAAVVGDLSEAGYTDADEPVFIQSFEVDNLKELDTMTDLPLVQLLWIVGQPYDQEQAGTTLTYDDMATPAGLADIAQYADGVGPEKYYYVIPRDADDEIHIENATSFVDDAHAESLMVHPFTFRAENRYLPANYQVGDDPNGIGDLAGEIGVFIQAGIDGYFTDQPDFGTQAKLQNTAVGPIYSVSLDGSNEVPPVSDGDADGSGDAKVIFWEDRGAICLDVAVDGIGDVTLGHIHEGESGVNGAVVVDFGLTQDDVRNGVAFRCAAVEAAVFDAILADPAGYYVNIHTAEFPGGAIRGQLAETPDPEIPEAPIVVLLTLSAALIGAGAVLFGMRRSSIAATSV